MLTAAFAEGVGPVDVYVDVIAGALAGVGTQWENGVIDVAAEHVATATAGRLLARLSAELPAEVRLGAVIVATPPDEHHAMPGFVLAEVLRLSGFEVVNLGSNLPLGSLCAAVARTPRLTAVCIGGTVVGAEAMAECVAAVRAVAPAGVDVFAGGQSVPDELTAVAIGASGWAADARDVPQLLGCLEGAPSSVSVPSRPTEEMVRRLQGITDAALAHLDLDDLLDEVTAQTIAALGADTMAIFLCEEGELVARATRCPKGLLREDVRVPMGEGVAGRVASQRSMVVVDDLAASAPESPLYVSKGVRSLVGVPLVVGGELLGAVHVGSVAPSRFTEADGQFLQLVADRTAQAIDRARLFAAEREARTLAEAAQRRLAFLTTAGEELARSLDQQTLLDTVVRQSVPFLADWCAVDFADPDATGGVRCVAAVHRNPGLVPLVRQLHDSRPSSPSLAKGVGRVLKTRESQFRQVVHESDLEAAAGSPERLKLFQMLGPGSVIIVPLVVRGDLLGAVSFVHSTSGRRYTEADLDLAEELVRRAALALDNARLFEERSEVARTLQASLLPPHLPEIPSAELDAVFQAGGEGVDVGGDFYDVFQTEPGDWALVIGDVCGKGAEAAAVTALGRYTLRAAAMQARRPSRVLHVLNEAMLRQDSARPFLTVAYARLQVGDDGARVTVGCAGHPLPMVLRASGEVEVVGSPGTLLGCFPEIEVDDVSTDLHRGDALVLFTDGVNEARDGDGVELGVDGVRDVLASCAGMSAASINERLHAAATSRLADGRPADDIAVLTLRLI